MAKCRQCGREYSRSFWEMETTPRCPECKEKREAEIAPFRELLVSSTPRLLVTPIIAGLNLLVFVVMVVSGVSFYNPTVEQLINWGANFGPLTLTGEWWRVLTSTFVHIGLVHLAVNMWCLLNLGALAERLFGNWTFLLLYILSGLAGSVASLWWNPLVVSAGASGAVFGVAGGLIGFLLVGRLEVPRAIVKENLTSIVVFVAYNLFYGLRASGIDNAAHLGGLAVGFVIGALLHRPLPATKPVSRLRQSVVIAVVALGLVVGGSLARKQVVDDADLALLGPAGPLTLDDFFARFTDAVEADLRDNPVVIEHLGRLEELEIDLEASMSLPGEEEFVFNAFGSKGRGVITAVCPTAAYAPQEHVETEVVSGTLEADDGEIHDLFPGNAEPAALPGTP